MDVNCVLITIFNRLLTDGLWVTRSQLMFDVVVKCHQAVQVLSVNVVLRVINVFINRSLTDPAFMWSQPSSLIFRTMLKLFTARRSHQLFTYWKQRLAKNVEMWILLLVYWRQEIIKKNVNVHLWYCILFTYFKKCLVYMFIWESYLFFPMFRHYSALSI